MPRRHSAEALRGPGDGNPRVASDLPALARSSRSPAAGRLVQATRIDDLAAAIIDLADDAAERRGQGSNRREYVRRATNPERARRGASCGPRTAAGRDGMRDGALTRPDEWLPRGPDDLRRSVPARCRSPRRWFRGARIDNGDYRQPDPPNRGARALDGPAGADPMPTVPARIFLTIDTEDDYFAFPTCSPGRGWVRNTALTGSSTSSSGTA